MIFAERAERSSRMGLGQSPFPVPPPVVDALRQSASQKAYLPVSGLAQLREAVADHHRRTFAISTRADDVLIGPGSKELMFILRLVYEGDLVIPAPSWVSYAPQARILARDVSWLPTRAAGRLAPEAAGPRSAMPGRPRSGLASWC